jgi:hypothetical protein
MKTTSESSRSSDVSPLVRVELLFVLLYEYKYVVNNFGFRGSSLAASVTRERHKEHGDYLTKSS